ncbi:hypothetical protein [Krasilnikovia sp. M28-CT-15]|uniref:hypothetical protein n=1 Tax=Krasilnikovia sp. M28-CT-15 TaxID=3373540 RepID=UPI00399D28AD
MSISAAAETITGALLHAVPARLVLAVLGMVSEPPRCNSTTFLDDCAWTRIGTGLIGVLVAGLVLGVVYLVLTLTGVGLLVVAASRLRRMRQHPTGPRWPLKEVAMVGAGSALLGSTVTGLAILTVTYLQYS